MQHIVIIGAGQAAAWAAYTLRQEGFEGQISVVSNETRVFYERPPLSKQILAGEMESQQLDFFPAATVEQLHLSWFKPDQAIKIDRQQRQIQLQSGRLLGYDKLLIATGSRPKLPSPHWQSMANVMTLRTLEDAQQLAEKLTRMQHLVIVGGGWIGLEIAATARKKGIAVTIYELGSRLCARSVSVEVSDFLQRIHAQQGVQFKFNCGAVALEELANGQLSILQQPKTVLADAVVVGAGAEIAKELAVAAGLSTSDGIVVDAQGQTSDPDIYAAGDVAIHPQLGVCLQSWANAQNQAIVAAKAMLGQQADYADVPWLWSDQYHYNIQILGSYANHSTLDLVLRKCSDDQLSFLYLDQSSRLQYVVAVNDAKLIKMAKRWMKANMILDPDLLSDSQFNVMSIKVPASIH
jgi:3-phenylpropionate/trans-cinnamate dioxygenase ferredoxin reductase subunit